MSLFPNTLPIGKIAGTACDPIPFRFQNFFVPLRRCFLLSYYIINVGRNPGSCQLIRIASLIEAATPSFSAPMQKYFLDE